MASLVFSPISRLACTYVIRREADMEFHYVFLFFCASQVREVFGISHKNEKSYLTTLRAFSLTCALDNSNSLLRIFKGTP